MIRGEYDPTKVARVQAPFRTLMRRLRASAIPDPGGGPGDRPPFDGYRLVLVGVVLVLFAITASVVSIPIAAFMARSVRNVNAKLGAETSRVVLPAIAQRSVVVAKDGRTLAVLTGDEDRKIVELADIPPITQEAVLAIEDSRFYEHHGVDAAGVLRALFTNAGAGGIREGGSTITQQLVKNTLTGGEKTLDRKLKEAQLAIRLEKEIPKQRILELYLNEAYFGSRAYGIGTAAEIFFGTNVKNLDLRQSALLAGLISSPSKYDPFKYPETARARRNAVLQRMADLGNISQAEAHAAALKPLGVSLHALAKPAEPYFVEFVRKQILADSHFGASVPERTRALLEGGLRIETTLDVGLQDTAKKAVSEVLDQPNDPSAALVSIEPSTGAIRTMIGGQDYNRLKYNLASAKRQPGSTFKPFALAAALDAGVPPTLTLDTPSPITVKDPETGQEYKVQNYDRRGEGVITLRRATELSVNSFYAQLSVRVGLKRIAETAKRMGINSEIKPLLSIALGTQDVSPLEMSSAYSTLANGGIHCKPFAITRVSDAAGKTIMQNDPQCDRALDSSVAATESNILQGVIAHGTGRSADLGRPACGKTGTTEDLGDAWFAGYTPQYSTIVWIGFKEGSSHPLRNIHGYDKVFGGTLPAAIWKRFMLAAHKDLPVVDFPKPPDIKKVEVPDVTGKPQDEARKTLEDAGFTVRTKLASSAIARGTVLSQDPAAGKKVDPGSMITLTLSDGHGSSEPPPSPSPSPSPSPTPSESPSPSPSPSKQ